MLPRLCNRGLALRRLATRICALPILLCLILALPTGLLAQQPLGSGASPSTSEAIQAVLTKQAADWNRGDLYAFAAGYKNAPDILFIGSTVRHGYADMLAGYRTHYPTRDAMGTLSFSALSVQPLDAQFATATGHFHLQRSAAGGGDADGYFLLVLERTASGWKIIRDDTTALPSRSVEHQ